MSSINQSVLEYVEQKDVEATRTMLTTIGYVADSAAMISFEESTEYAKSNLGDLFQDDDGRTLDFQESEEGYKQIIKEMMSNFSEEKYKAAIRIGRKLLLNGKSEPELLPLEEKEEATESEDFFTKIKKHPAQTAIIGVAVVAILVAILVVTLNRHPGSN